MGDVYKGICLTPEGDAKIGSDRIADALFGKISKSEIKAAPPCTPEQIKKSPMGVSRYNM